MDKYLLSTEGVLFRKENYRLLSSGFIHADWVHFLMNMVAYFFFAFNLEVQHGHFLALFLFLGAVLAGSLFGLWNNRHNPYYRAVGASGGISGVVFASLISSKPSILLLYGIIPIPDWVFAISYFALSFIAMKNKKDNIGHDAHLSGLVFGIIFISIFRWEYVSERPYFLASMLGLITISIPLYLRPEFLTKKYWTNLKQEYQKELEEKEHNARVMDLDELLEKISQTGMESLSEKEKKRLHEISKQVK